MHGVEVLDDLDPRDDALRGEIVTEAEADSWAAGQAFVALVECRGYELPPMPEWLATLPGLTEVARIVLASLLQAQADEGHAVVSPQQPSRAFGLTAPQRGAWVAPALEELVALNLVVLTDDGDLWLRAMVAA